LQDKEGLLGGKQGCNAFQEVGSSKNAEPMYQLPNNFPPGMFLALPHTLEHFKLNDLENVEIVLPQMWYSPNIDTPF